MAQEIKKNSAIAETEKDQTKGIGEEIVDTLSDAFSDNRFSSVRSETAKSEGFFPTLGTGILEVSKPIAETALDRSRGLLTNQALSFAYTMGDLSSLSNVLGGLLKELNAVNNPNEPNCKILSTIVDKNGNIIKPKVEEASLPPDPSIEDYAIGCLEKSSLYKSATGGDNSSALGVISSILDVISELNKPADPAECINPYFDQFFNLIPVQFIIAKYLRDMIKSALAGLSDQEVQEIVRNVDPCGQELTKIYSNNLDIPELRFPLFKLPAIPTIPNVNLYAVLNKLMVEAVCYGICVTLTPLTVWLAKIMTSWLNDFLNEETIGAGSYTEFLNGSLGKIYLNKEISDEVLKQAITQKKIGDYSLSLSKEIGPPQNNARINRNGFWRDPTSIEQQKVLNLYISLIRNYFNEIYDFKSQPFTKKTYNAAIKKFEDNIVTRELGTKELVFLLLGEYNCFTIQDLVSIGNKPEFLDLKLTNEQEIVRFFTFIGGSIDPVKVVTDLKKEGCPPEPCEKIDDAAVEQIQNKMSELCKVLNLEKSGLPPIPINEILKTLGMQNLFNDGIKEQFKQLKTEQLLYLGFPSLNNFPTSTSISNPFLPKENGDFNDYDMWTSGQIQDPSLFRFYFLRGGPPLIWRYENVNINDKLAGTTLEDICGEEETFVETFVYVLKDIFKIDFNSVDKSLQKDKEIYKESFSKRIELEFDKRKGAVDDQFVVDDVLKSYEDKKQEERSGFDDDEEGLVSDFAKLYKTYKHSYDQQKAAKDRLRNRILGVRKDAGSGWVGIDVFTFVDIDMGYGKGYASAIYGGLTADDYDF